MTNSRGSRSWQPRGRRRALVVVILALALIVLALVGLAIFLGTRRCDCAPFGNPTDSVVVAAPGSGAGSGTATVGGLVVTLGGRASGSLSPGTSSPIDMTFDNPNSSIVALDHIVVSIRSISSPQATAGLPCSAADYFVVQTVAPLRVVLPANSSSSLSSQGLPRSSWPRIGMINSRVDQAGCKLATVILLFSAGATQ